MVRIVRDWLHRRELTRKNRSRSQHSTTNQAYSALMCVLSSLGASHGAVRRSQGDRTAARRTAPLPESRSLRTIEGLGLDPNLLSTAET